MIRLNDLVVWEPLNFIQTQSGGVTLVNDTTVPAGEVWEITGFALRAAIVSNSNNLSLYINSTAQRIAAFIGTLQTNQVLTLSGTVWADSGVTVGGFIAGGGIGNRQTTLILSGRRYYV